MSDKAMKQDGSYTAKVRATVEIKVEGSWSTDTTIRQVRAHAIREAEDKVLRAPGGFKWRGSQTVTITEIKEDC